MSYIRTIWKNGQTALNADNLNNIEDGLEEALHAVSDMKTSAPMGATVGQVPFVKAIDENGKATWGATDHYYSYKDLLFLWNGITTDLEHASLTEFGSVVYKVSDTPVSLEDLQGSTIHFVDSSTGETGEVVLNADDIDVNGGALVVSPLFISVVEATAEIDGVILTQGMWHFKFNFASGYVSKIESTEKIKKIDKKYLPDVSGLPTVTEADNGKHLEVVEGAWKVVEKGGAENPGINTGGVSSWNDLKDKPFGEETIVYFEVTDGYEPIEQIATEDGVIFYKVVEEGLTLEQIVGSTVYIRMDGNVYESVATEDDLVIEDGVISSGDSIFSVTDVCVVQGATLSTGTWIVYDPTFYIEKIEKFELKTIDSKFLPDELYTEIDARIDAYIEEALGGEY